MTDRYGFLIFVVYKSVIFLFAVVKHGNDWLAKIPSWVIFPLTYVNYLTELCHVTWELSCPNHPDTQ